MTDALGTRVTALEGTVIAGGSPTAGGPVAVVATGNVTLSGEQTIDGVTTSASRVLLVGQTDPAENGIWVTASGAWTRATDMDEGAEVQRTYVYVTGGTVGRGRTYFTGSEVTTIGTDDIVFTEFQNGNFLLTELDAKLDDADLLQSVTIAAGGTVEGMANIFAAEPDMRNGATWGDVSQADRYDIGTFRAAEKGSTGSEHAVYTGTSATTTDTWFFGAFIVSTPDGVSMPSATEPAPGTQTEASGTGSFSAISFASTGDGGYIDLSDDARLYWCYGYIPAGSSDQICLGLASVNAGTLMSWFDLRLMAAEPDASTVTALTQALAGAWAEGVRSAPLLTQASIDETVLPTPITIASGGTPDGYDNQLAGEPEMRAEATWQTVEPRYQSRTGATRAARKTATSSEYAIFSADAATTTDTWFFCACIVAVPPGVAMTSATVPNPGTQTDGSGFAFISTSSGDSGYVDLAEGVRLFWAYSYIPSNTTNQICVGVTGLNAGSFIGSFDLRLMDVEPSKSTITALTQAAAGRWANGVKMAEVLGAQVKRQPTVRGALSVTSAIAAVIRPSKLFARLNPPKVHKPSAGTIYVAAPDAAFLPAGSDADGDGSREAPYATLTQALSVVPSTGDYLILCDGSFAEDNAGRFILSGEFDLPVVFRPYVEGSASITNASGTNGVINVRSAAASNIQFDGLTILPSTDGCTTIWVNPSAGTALASNILFFNCRLVQRAYTSAAHLIRFEADYAVKGVGFVGCALVGLSGVGSTPPNIILTPANTAQVHERIGFWDCWTEGEWGAFSYRFTGTKAVTVVGNDFKAVVNHALLLGTDSSTLSPPAISDALVIDNDFLAQGSNPHGLEIGENVSGIAALNRVTSGLQGIVVKGTDDVDIIENTVRLVPTAANGSALYPKAATNTRWVGNAVIIEDTGLLAYGFNEGPDGANLSGDNTLSDTYFEIHGAASQALLWSGASGSTGGATSDGNEYVLDGASLGAVRGVTVTDLAELQAAWASDGLTGDDTANDDTSTVSAW